MKLTTNHLIMSVIALSFAFFLSITGTLIVSHRLSKTQTELNYKAKQNDSLKAELSGLYEIIEYKDSIIK